MIWLTLMADAQDVCGGGVLGFVIVFVFVFVYHMGKEDCGHRSADDCYTYDEFHKLYRNLLPPERAAHVNQCAACFQLNRLGVGKD